MGLAPPKHITIYANSYSQTWFSQLIGHSSIQVLHLSTHAALESTSVHFKHENILQQQQTFYRDYSQEDIITHGHVTCVRGSPTIAPGNKLTQQRC